MTPRRRRTIPQVATGASPVGVVRRHRPDYQILLYMGMLVLLGLVVLYAISPARVELINQAGNSLDQAHFMEKQLLYLGIGLTGFAAAAALPLMLIEKYATKVLSLGFIACVLLAVLGLFLDGGIVIESGGATRWFNLGVTSFQPAELLKFGLLLYGAVFLGKKMQEGRVSSFEHTLVPIGIVVGLAGLFIIVFQKDMGTGITMLGMVMSMLIVAGVRVGKLAAILLSVVTLGVLLIATSPHRVQRVLTFLSGSSDDPASYHITQASIALGSGGLTGKGLGQSVQAFGYLPEAINDSIFAILGETFGFVGVMLILVLFYVLLKRILRVVDYVENPVWRLIAAGMFGLIATHVIVNVGAMTGVFPLTGVTLPFLSFGGTSLLFMMIGLGLVFQISRFTSHRITTEKEQAQHEGAMRGRGLWRTRHASTRRYQRAQ